MWVHYSGTPGFCLLTHKAAGRCIFYKFFRSLFVVKLAVTRASHGAFLTKVELFTTKRNEFMLE